MPQSQKILGYFLMRNIDIFKTLYEPHTSRTIDGFDSAVNSDACSIGLINGQFCQLNAIVTESAIDEDQWSIVNLKVMGQNWVNLSFLIKQKQYFINRIQLTPPQPKYY